MLSSGASTHSFRHSFIEFIQTLSHNDCLGWPKGRREVEITSLTPKTIFADGNLYFLELTANILSPTSRRPSLPAAPSCRMAVTKIPGSVPMWGWSDPPRILKPNPAAREVKEIH